VAAGDLSGNVVYQVSGRIVDRRSGDCRFIVAFNIAQ
jgi:hypothetical protein